MNLENTCCCGGENKEKKQIDETLEKLNYKIARYEVAVETGKLTWDKE